MNKLDCEVKDITNETKNLLDKKIEIDTTEKKWIRNCPECNVELIYKYKENFSVGCKRNTSCVKCCRSKKFNDNFTRNCPVCNKKLNYSSHRKLENAIEKNSLCLSCSKMGNKNPQYGKPMNPKLKEILKKFSGKNNPWYGKTHTPEIIQKIKEAKTGEKHPLYGRTGEKHPLYGKRGKDCVHYGKKRSEETKQKIREKILEHVDKLGGSSGYNPKACKIFDEINKELGWNGQHMLYGGEKRLIGYSIDYYEPTLNIVIEYNEKRHYRDFNKNILKEKDIIRNNKIINHLNCKFYIIKENADWKNVLFEFLK